MIKLFNKILLNGTIYTWICLYTTKSDNRKQARMIITVNKMFLLFMVLNGKANLKHPAKIGDFLSTGIYL